MLPMVPGQADGAPVGPAAGLLGTSAWTVLFKLLSGVSQTSVAVTTARALGPTGRGVLVLLVTIALLSSLIGSLGANVGARLHLVSPEDPMPSGHFVGLLVALVAAQLVVCLAVASLLLPLADVHLPLGERLLFSALGAAMLGAYLLNDGLNSYGFVADAAAVDAFGSFVQLLAVGSALVAGATTVAPVGAGLVLGSSVQVVTALLVLRRRGVDTRPRRDPRAWRLLVRTGLPGMAAALAEVFTFRIDRYLLALFATPAAVGVYSVASTASEVLRLPSLAVGSALFHRLASGTAEVADFRTTRRLCLLVTALMAAAVAVVAPPLIELAFGPDYAGAVTPLRIVLLGELGIAVYQMDGSSLAGRGRVGSMAVAAACGLVVVVLADVGLMGPFGVAGAAWASVIAYWVMGAVAWWSLRRTVRREAGAARR
jgi:O-antigen/teichoic acid export membrane protein